MSLLQIQVFSSSRYQSCSEAYIMPAENDSPAPTLSTIFLISNFVETKNRKHSCAVSYV
jgi:hypothetical protein